MRAQICPVCDGKGLVEKGFYDADEDETEECRSCNGAGYIFVPIARQPCPRPYPVPMPYSPPWDGTWVWTETTGSPDYDVHITCSGISSTVEL